MKLLPVCQTKKSQKRDKVENETEADSHSLSWCVFLFPLMCLGLRSMAREVSQAPHSVTITTSSRELIDLKAGCQGGLGPRRQPGTAVSTQLLAMYLCMLSCSHFHLQEKPECTLQNQLVAIKHEWLCYVYTVYRRIKSMRASCHTQITGLE